MNPIVTCADARHGSVYQTIATWPGADFIYDTLIQDNLTVDRLRNYPPDGATPSIQQIDGTAVKP
jgi:hypothetical protein